ncbi:MAG: DUF4197 domain-containing protein, partial [Flavisolibacter sp.]
MKRYLIALTLVIGLSSCDTLSNIASTYGPVTESEAATGIREALDQGVSRGISLLNKEDGFLGNQFYKILLPPEAVKIENTLRQLGMGSLVDRAIIQINRGAEDAVGHARPIFVDAIRQMTIADALTIIKGPRDAATQYFKNKTTQQLIAAFSPIIKSSLDKFSATKYYA